MDSVERTCSCAVSAFVLGIDGRVRCSGCQRPITGRSPARGPEAAGGLGASGESAA